MDLQWRNQCESEKQDSTKMPKFLLEQPLSASALPLFVPEPNNTKVNTLLALSDPTLAAATRFSRMGSYFSFAQWQELELQALIFRYMLVGATVPHELLQSINTSFLPPPPCFLQQPASLMLPSGYWGRAAMDPEPDRCRRTDGKKWRCSRDVVAGQKYCERHIYRGRNRSRKPVELATSPTPGGDGEALGVTTSLRSPSLPTASFKSPFDLLHPSERSSGMENLFENRDHVERDVGSDGQKLRHFFDDWPRSLQEPNDGSNSNVGRMNSVTGLSNSTPETTCSDVSLKLSTGYGEDPKQLQMNWMERWRSASEEEASMGGPLAEALRSSTSTPSLPRVLLQLPPTSSSGTSFLST